MANELLIVIDDVFPKKLSSFRNVEFTNYLNEFKNVLIINTSKVPLLEEEYNFLSNYQNAKFYQTNFKDENIKEIDKYLKSFKKVIASIVFLNNIYNEDDRILTFLEKNNIKFIFTLYPGGGFFINQETKNKLTRVFNSKVFYKVIVTQPKTLEFIKTNKLCPPDKIKYIYGLPVSEELLNLNTKNHRHYGINGKINLNICFVAFKYSPEGKDKGYDIFIDVAKKLKQKFRDVYFHVVGNFDGSDIDVTELDERIAFYGAEPTSWFPNFYKDKDIILSPTRPNILSKGAFDGFPTGASTDAMLNEILVLATDHFNLNKEYKNGEDLIIINEEVDEIVSVIAELKNNPKRLYQIAKNGYKKANELYSSEKQITTRLNLIKEMSELNE